MKKRMSKNKKFIFNFFICLLILVSCGCSNSTGKNKSYNPENIVIEGDVIVYEYLQILNPPSAKEISEIEEDYGCKLVSSKEGSFIFDYYYFRKLRWETPRALVVG